MKAFPYIAHGIFTPSVAPPVVTETGVVGMGDSVMAGHTLTNPTVERWLYKFCQANGYVENNFGVVSMSMQDASYPGHPVFDKTTIPAKTATDKYLFFQFGINDMLGLVNGYSFTTAGFKTAYQAAIDYAISTKLWTAGRIVLHSPSYIIPGLTGVSLTLQSSYSQATLELAQANHTIYIDTNSNMVSYPGGFDSYLPDYVHPNAAGHTIMANLETAASFTPQ